MKSDEIWKSPFVKRLNMKEVVFMMCSDVLDLHLHLEFDPAAWVGNDDAPGGILDDIGSFSF